MVLTQSCIHYLCWRNDKQAYIPTGIYRELDSTMLKKLHIYIDPLGHYYFDNKFLDKLITNDSSLGDLSNIRFKLQDQIMRAGPKLPLQAAMLLTDYFKNKPIQIGVDEKNNPIYCHKPEMFKLLFALEEPTIYDMQSTASRFACDCLGFDYNSFDRSKLNQAQDASYTNAFRSFLRKALDLHRPIQYPSNIDLSLVDFIRFVVFTNMTMHSPSLTPRSKRAQNWMPIFTIITYFLLATEAAVLGIFYTRFIK